MRCRLSYAVLGIMVMLSLLFSEGCYTQPPYSKAPGQPVRLVNNQDAVDPTWEQLMTFLTTDKTDQEDYSLFSFPCGAFAEEVHNSAEAAGIKTAFVAVSFEGETELHALNAFETIDKGLVYIDCTGETGAEKSLHRVPQFYIGGTVVPGGKCSPDNFDTIAYVEKGQEYGRISISKAMSPQYSFYSGYTQEWQDCENAIKNYNEEVAEYSQAVWEYSVYVPVLLTPQEALAYNRRMEEEFNRLKAWEEELDKKRQALESLASELGDYWWEPPGVVCEIEVYW